MLKGFLKWLIVLTALAFLSRHPSVSRQVDSAINEASRYFSNVLGLKSHNQRVESLQEKVQTQSTGAAKSSPSASTGFTTRSTTGSSTRSTTRSSTPQSPKRTSSYTSNMPHRSVPSYKY